MKLKELDNWEAIPIETREKVEQALADDIMVRYNNSTYHNEDIIHTTLADNGYRLKDEL